MNVEREKRRELEEGLKKLEENQRTALSEMERRQRILQQTRDMLAEMDAELNSGLAVMKRTADNLAAARRDDDEATNKKNDTMAAARWDDDKTTKKEDDMTAAGYHEGTTETKTGGGVEFPQKKEDLKKQTDGQSRTKHRDGNSNKCGERER